MSRSNTYNADRTAKKCSACKAMLPVADYQPTWKRNVAGVKVIYLRAECRKCNTKRSREWAAANRERRKPVLAEQAADWRARNLEHYRSYQAAYHRMWSRNNKARIANYESNRKPQ